MAAKARMHDPEIDITDKSMTYSVIEVLQRKEFSAMSPEELAQIKQLIQTTKPHYHLMGGLHSGETGPSEMLLELVYRLATETSPFISQIRDNVIVSVTPVADADGRDR